ncbi:MAG TPA: hypothetical protein ENJ19_03590 [Gammaproteobacteria bacterium]|nr:hypothetical protein [Gammaproteobacteria bacterium]
MQSADPGQESSLASCVVALSYFVLESFVDFFFVAMATEPGRTLDIYRLLVRARIIGLFLLTRQS